MATALEQPRERPGGELQPSQVGGNERVPARPQIPNERSQAGLFSAEKHGFVKNKPLCRIARMKLHAIYPGLLPPGYLPLAGYFG